MNILITAASTAQAYRLARLLGEEALITFADSTELPALVMKNRSFVTIPPAGSASFAHELLTICLDHGINKVFALRREELKALAEARTLFEEYGILVMVPPLQVLQRMTMGSAGKIVIREGDGPASSAGAEADRGVFIAADGESEAPLSVFTVD